MTYTRPWTPREEHILANWYRGKRSAGKLARQLHRSPGAIIERAKRVPWHLRIDAMRTKQRIAALPSGVPQYDPGGTICLTCGEPRRFDSDDGRTFAECRCGRQFIRVRRL